MQTNISSLVPAVALMAMGLAGWNADAKELQIIGHPEKVMPRKAMQVRFNADGTVTPLSDWFYFEDSSRGGEPGIASSSLNLFDSFENDGNNCIVGGTPTGGTACGLPGGGYRWFFGRSYCNMFTVGSFTATSTTSGDRLEVAWYWYCTGSGAEECFVGVFTGDPFDSTCAANYVLGMGVILGFGSLPCDSGDYFYTDACLCDFGMALDMFTSTYATIGGVLAKAFDGETLTPATCGQFMLWGADGCCGGGLAGTHGDLEYDDDYPPDGKHTPFDECYSTNFECPDPMHWMVGVGTCDPEVCADHGCGASVNCRFKSMKCRITPPHNKLILKGTGTADRTLCVRDGAGAYVGCAQVGADGKWKFVQRKVAPGAHVRDVCGSVRTAECGG
ncbi:MAG: hypothetical protein IT449_10150 [Phycisphaerales bacterium]|nr:hypothetical protein [Phycisphaerales bacterium]